MNQVVLVIDTATPAVTAGVVDSAVDAASGGARCSVLAERTTVGAKAHAERITPNVLAALADAGMSMADLDAVVVGCGPGPFTGLRVGMATAAAYGHALSIPVYGVCSLDAIGLAASASASASKNEILVVTDARRREVYWARYRDGIRIAGPEVCAPADVDAHTAQAVAGSPAHAALFDLPILDVTYPSAAGLVAAVGNWNSEPGPLVPLYLRRPDATMQSAAMLRSGGIGTDATMQWGHPQPRSGEGDAAMLRSGGIGPDATMQWGHPQPRSGEGSAAMLRSGGIGTDAKPAADSEAPATIGALADGDAAACAELEARLFGGDDPWPAAAFRRALRTRDHHYVAARAAGALVGYAGIARLGRTPPFEYEVHTIGVDPAYQGRGVGRRMLADLLDFADGGVVYLEVRTDNTAAIALYRDVGFVEVGLRKRYYRASGADAYMMRREARASDDAERSDVEEWRR